MDEWQGFFSAGAGAAATLSGLILVGVSINLNKILSAPKLADRALQALMLLSAVLVVGLLLLVPGQTASLLGIEILLIGLLAWGAVTAIDLRNWRSVEDDYRRLLLQSLAINQLALIPYTLAGVTLLWQGFGGLYWLAPALLVFFAKAILDSWVLLVEIDR